MRKVTMEELAVVLFMGEEEKKGRKNRFSPFVYQVEREYLEKPGVTLFRVHFPLWDRKKKAWTPKTMEEYREGLPVPPESGRVCYLYDRRLGEAFGWQNEALSEVFTEAMMLSFSGQYDYALLFDDKRTDIETLIRRDFLRVRNIVVVTDEEERFFDLQEELSQEYGLLLSLWPGVRGRHIPNGKRTVYFLGEDFYDLRPENIAQGSLLYFAGGPSLMQRGQYARRADCMDLRRFLGLPRGLTLS